MKYVCFFWTIVSCIQFYICVKSAVFLSHMDKSAIISTIVEGTMITDYFKSKPVMVHTADVVCHVSPEAWNGDPSGHIGEFDVFFYVVEGEVILSVDSNYFTIKPGHLAFLPRGRMRRYAPVSDVLKMFEIRFVAELAGNNLMGSLGINDNNLVITVPDNEKMFELFLKANREEVNKDPIFEIICSENILSIIRIFTETSKRKSHLSRQDIDMFEKLINYMQENIDKTITINDLTKIAHTERTYLIKKFKKIYEVPPLTYFSNMKYHKTVELLIDSNLTIEKISHTLGITDVSYFSRWFKKNCNMSPTEFRRLFHR